MKKQYIKPDTSVVEIKQKCGILNGGSDAPRYIRGNGDLKKDILSDEDFEEEIIIR